MKLPANKNLKSVARNLRNNATLGEVLLWNILKKRHANGLDFDRQKVIGNYIVDFYCAKIRLVIEVDGNSHDDKYEYDKTRDEYLQSLGVAVLHIDDRDVRFNMNKVLYAIDAAIANASEIQGMVLR